MSLSSNANFLAIGLPGMRYVVFVNGRSLPVMMENMRQRISRGDIETEKTEAINVLIPLQPNSPKSNFQTNIHHTFPGHV